ncbi:type II secretion system protein [Aureliella helgolandensis]|uniref:Type II secretion system protein G n=1 Tax=Aureliella helgolandensis TaxID=2527968 RepID=A0A518G193_9BACT|nr:type II secretion system protein [Aureliella helgolandensis]QDV22367.1 hypothetical protein Q31a_06510 [Aureliella helgolandensis]
MTKPFSCSIRTGFSLVETSAAAVIMIIVGAATVATLSPLSGNALEKAESENLAKLNCMVQAYNIETGLWPDEQLHALYEADYTAEPENATPYGGYYRWDADAKRVYNPNLPDGALRLETPFEVE